jgi:DNA repair protein SbcD/Mre11
MIKFFHTADFHLGVENYGKLDPKTGIHSRLLDFKSSLEQCINLAIKEKIDFFLFCGDAYKTAFPTPTQQKILVELLFKLYKANIPVIILIGNHDHPLSFGKANSLDIFKDLPVDGFHVFSKPEILKLKTKNGIVQIVGIPWPTRNNVITQNEFHLKSTSEITSYLSQSVTQIIRGLADQLDPKIPSILAGHLTVGTGIFSGSEKCAVFGNDPIFLPSDLALKNFDYVALGHLHRHQNLNSGGYPAVVYSGSIERVDFGERKEEKGFCKIYLQKEKTVFEFVPLQIRPMIQIEVSLNSNQDQTEQIVQVIEKNQIKDAIVKIVYHIPDNKQDNANLKEIQRICQDAICLTAIIPVRKIITKEKRASLNVDMDLNTLLQKYFEAKGFSNARKSELSQKLNNLIQKKDAEQMERASCDTKQYEDLA